MPHKGSLSTTMILVASVSSDWLIMNLTRKSKLWDLSIDQHEKLAQAMLGDFGAAFGREILAAYTAQVRKARGR